MAKRSKNKHENIDGAFATPVFQWSAPEFMRYKRGPIWYAIVTLLMGGFIAYGYFTGSWTMIVAFAALYLTVLLQHRKHPKMQNVVISPYGVKFGPKRIPYSQMKKFWIIHEPPFVDQLHIQTGDRLHPELVIPLMGVDASIIREYLLNKIPEWEGKKEDFSDTIIRLFRLA